MKKHRMGKRIEAKSNGKNMCQKSPMEKLVRWIYAQGTLDWSQYKSPNSLRKDTIKVTPSE